MKKELIFCDLCPVDKLQLATHSCLVCCRDICTDHNSGYISAIFARVASGARTTFEGPPVCKQCILYLPQVALPMPLFAEMEKYTQEIITQTRAAISAKTLEGEAATPDRKTIPYAPANDASTKAKQMWESMHSGFKAKS